MAWMLLKFQPSEGRFLGEGQNQMVYEKDGEPNVTKVGRAETIGDMYLHELLNTEVPIFAGQRPIAQTMPLPTGAESRMGNEAPILSEQARGTPLEEGRSRFADNIRGRQLVEAIQRTGNQGPLLEALGIADLKPPNWMQTISDKGVPVRVVTGDPVREGKAVIHDPMFYGPTNPPGTLEGGIAQTARGDPRRLGVDYTIPDETKESFARRVDELPFGEFAQPVFDSEVPMSPAQEDLLQERVGEQDERVQSILRRIGVKS